MFSYGKEVMDFINVCESINARLAAGQLPAEDRDIIEYTAIDLLNRVSF